MSYKTFSESGWDESHEIDYDEQNLHHDSHTQVEQMDAENVQMLEHLQSDNQQTSDNAQISDHDDNYPTGHASAQPQSSTTQPDLDCKQRQYDHDNECPTQCEHDEHVQNLDTASSKLTGTQQDDVELYVDPINDEFPQESSSSPRKRKNKQTMVEVGNGPKAIPRKKGKTPSKKLVLQALNIGNTDLSLPPPTSPRKQSDVEEAMHNQALIAEQERKRAKADAGTTTARGCGHKESARGRGR